MKDTNDAEFVEPIETADPVSPGGPLIVLASLGVVLFLGSAGVPALRLENQQTYPSLLLLLLGWVGVFGILDGDFYAAGWLANPLFLIGTCALLVRRYRLAAGMMIAAAAVSWLSVLLREVMIDEGGTMAKVEGFHIGFWIWQAAIWFNLVVSVVAVASSRPRH